MITAKQVKDVAALVGAIAGIATGIDKIKTVSSKWIDEYKGKRDERQVKKDVEQSEPDEQ
jgi:ADP-ribosylglycohydrolase